MKEYETKVHIHIEVILYLLQDGNRNVEEEIPRRGIEAHWLQRNKIERILKKARELERQIAVVEPYSHTQLRHQTRMRPGYSLGYRIVLLEFARGRHRPHTPVLSCCSKQLWELLAAFARRERTQYFVRLVWAVT